MVEAASVWHTKTITELETVLQTSTTTGLSPTEIKRRQEEIGVNTIEEHQAVSPVKLFLSQFNDFMIWVLLAALIISSVILREIIDALAIGAILILNAALGFRQEYRAEQALKTLKEMAAPNAMVMRDGEELELNSIELVPGDIIFLSSGDRIPADCRLIESTLFKVDESALTGESHSVSKSSEILIDETLPLSEKINMGFAGTTVTKGRAKAIVIATGNNTEMGKIAELIQAPDEPTPLQIELKKVGKILAIGALFVSVFVFVFGAVVRGFPIGEIFLVAVSLAVASIPEGLPAIVTMALSLGVQEMANRHTIIRKLHAVETLGSADFICTDKTGTVTENRMTVNRIFTDKATVEINEGPNSSLSEPSLELVRVAQLCNDARFGKNRTLIGDPTETALFQAALNLGIDIQLTQRQYPRLGEIPFDSQRKMMTTFHNIGDYVFALTKGAPEIVLAHSNRLLSTDGELSLTASELENYQNLNKELAEAGYRVLAFAKRRFSRLPTDIEPKTIEKDLTFIGFAAINDPPRSSVKNAITACRRAGIRVAMITGDNLLTARNIAKQIGLNGDRSINGAELEAMSEEELGQYVEDITVYARVAPVDKVKIVSALKSRNHIVAMTGDGINDAPALKRADIGIAMGKIGTDVAREAAEMVLTDDNFATIVSAVSYGRHVFDNLKKTILFLISCNISEVLVLFIAMMIPNLPLPLLPIQILWINLVTDGPPALALGVDPLTEDPMTRPPRPRDQGVLTGELPKLFWQGTAITIGVLFVFFWSLYILKTSTVTARTAVFTTMVFGQLLHSLNFRSEKVSVFSRQTLKNKFLIFAIIASFALQLGLIYLPGVEKIFHTAPLDLRAIVLVIVGATVPLILTDISKRLRNRKVDL